MYTCIYICIFAFVLRYLCIFHFLTIEIYTHTNRLSPKREALDKLTPRKHQGKKKKQAFLGSSPASLWECRWTLPDLTSFARRWSEWWQG